MPAEKVTGNGRSVSHPARSRWRKTSAPSGGPMTMRNSSPPNRPTVSRPLVVWRSTRPNARSTSSPAACPNVSLTCLKWSRSSMMTVSSGASLPRARSSMRRLGRPVSKSVHADSASRSFRPLSCNTCRASSRKGVMCRSRSARAALPGGAVGSSGSPSPNETSTESTPGSSVSAGTSRPPSSRTRCSAMRRASRPVRSRSRERVASYTAPGTWYCGSAGVSVSCFIRGPHPVPQRSTARR